MFSAIFGIFNGRVEEQQQQLNDETSKFSEASTQTLESKSTSTQVNLDTTKTNLNDTATSQQDWVIVDETETNENDKACGDNLVEMATDAAEPEPETEDPLIGSFFQKNETCDDEERWKSYRQQKQVEHNENTTVIDKPVEAQETVLAQKKTDTWLITPSPCLTSITESSQQKSMIDNDPLENLLIEQPTRFMSASTCVVQPTYAEVTKSPKIPQALSKLKPKKQQPEIQSKKPEVMQSDDICEINFLFNEVEAPVTPITKRTIAEKRKEAEKSSPSVSPTISESPKKISRKSTKSMKTKQTNQNAKFNKENMQVKTLLMAECFPKNETKQKGNRNRYGQMSRVNKNAALFSMATNTRQRKFHNLQQPSSFSNMSNQF